MGRIRNEIEIQGKKYWALFDSGARNIYITKDLAKFLLVQQLAEPLPASLRRQDPSYREDMYIDGVCRKEVHLY